MGNKNRILIIGAGKGGEALVSLFAGIKSVEIVGVCDANPDASGLLLAKKLGIATSGDCLKLIKQSEDIDEIINVTGNAKIKEAINKYKTSKTEVIDGQSARVLWQLVESYKAAGEEARSSQDRLKVILDSLVVGVLLVKTSDRRITYVNPVAAKVIGSEIKDIVGRSCHKFICPNDIGECPIIDHGQVVDCDEKILVKANGEQIPVLKTAKPVKIQDEDYIVDSFIDIREQKKDQEKLKNLIQEWEQTFDSISDMISIHDKDFRIVKANKTMVQALGLKPEDIIGKKCYELIHGTKNPWPTCPHKKSLDTKNPVREEIFDPNLGLYLEISTSPIFDSEGECTGSIHIAKDITEKQKSLERIRLSEIKHKALYESSRDAIIIYDPDEGFSSANSSALKMFGCKDEGEFLSKNFLDFSPLVQSNGDKSSERIRRIFDISLKKGSHFYEWTLKKLNGDELFVTILLTRMDLEGKILFQATVRDISQRKRSEVELNKLSWAIEQSPSILVITDLEGNITYANPKFSQVTGYSFAEAIGKNPRILKGEGISKNVYRDLWEKISLGNTWRGELNNRRKNGELYWELASISSIKDTYGKIIGFLKVSEDITIRKESEKMLHEAMEIKSQFISVVSHELRTPLAAIKEGIGIVADGSAGGVNEEQKDFLDLAKNNVDRLARLINDVLDFQKLSADKMKFNMRKNDLNLVVREVQKTMLYLAKDKGLELLLELEENLPLCRFDSDKITQVLTNLITNAIKFTDKGSVTIKTAKAEDSLCLEIIDTGVGMKKEDIPKLFRQFEQLDHGEARRTGGTGLGLVITKEIIQKHKGNIRVISEYGKGSSFIITLPEYDHRAVVVECIENRIIQAQYEGTQFLAFTVKIDNCVQLKNSLTELKLKESIDKIGQKIKSSSRKISYINSESDGELIILADINSDADVLDISESIKLSVKDIALDLFPECDIKFSCGYALYPIDGEKAEILLKKLKGDLKSQDQERLEKTIMVVDDDQEIAKSLKKILEKFGYKNIKQAYSGKEALEKIEMSIPDLLILDMKMPQMSGYEVIGRLKESSRTKDMQIIIMSGYKIEMSCLNKYIKEKTIPTLSKPVDIEQFRKCVEYLL